MLDIIVALHFKCECSILHETIASDVKLGYYICISAAWVWLQHAEHEKMNVTFDASCRRMGRQIRPLQMF